MKLTSENEMQAMSGVIALCLIAIVLALSGCTTKDVPKTEAAPVSHHEAATMAVSNCALAIKEIATATAGDAASKVAAVGAIERLCAQGGAQFAVRQYQAPEPSLGATLWQAGLQMADLFLRGYGIKTSRDVGINASNNQTAQAVSSYNAFAGIASSGFAANTAIATAPRAPGQVFNLEGSNGNSFGAGNANYAPVTGSYNPINPAPKVCSFVPATASTPAGFSCQ